MFACLHGQGNLTAIAFEFSPHVEATSEDTVTFDVSGLDRLFGLPQEIAAAIVSRARETDATASVAVAANPDAAICAARGFRATSVIPYGDESKFLGELPLTLLSPTPDLLETLDRWGIRRFQEMGALPPLGIAERLGPEGLHLRELARGECDRKLLLIPEPLCFEDEIELEYPVELLEPLAFLLARMINGLATRLATRGLATDELRLRLSLEDRTTHERTLRLPVPSLDTKAFLKLMQLDLEQHPPAAPVVKLWMGVNPVKPRAAQSGLYIPVAPEPVKLELTLARIRGIVGEERVGWPELVNTHRPDAFVAHASSVQRRDLSRRSPGFTQTPATSTRMSMLHATSVRHNGGSEDTCGTKLSLRIFRPARAAHVSLASGQPGFVAADGIRGKVLEFAGPWRTSGDWWTVDPWLRDEWDVALSDGALYRLYCNPRGWFVEGSYD
jgi:protein ImuB